MIKHKLNIAVFFPSSLIILGLILYSALSPDSASQVFSGIQAEIIENASWFYVLAVALILLFVVFLGTSRYGEIRLGPDHASPDYSFVTWLSMLFAAGMGIGLMFFGVAEPVMHYLSPPTAEPNSLEAIKEAMKTTFFHWGFHAWAIYTVVALVLAYFSYRLKLPLTLRSALYPLIGDRIFGWPGHLVDIFAVVSTVFGVATSLGLGATQVNSGLDYLFGLESSQTNQLLIMVSITLLAAISVATGLDKGIKRLSELNMVLAIVLLAMIFIVGSSVFLLQAYVQNVGHYLSSIVQNTFNLFAYKKTDWIGGWTIFYWGWWLAWAPFVGLFIARISRGRTIREFVLGVMLVPTAFTLLWMTIFGNSAISLIFDQGLNQLGELVNSNTSVALFAFLENFPLANLLSFVAVLMIVVFFVTSCDSGAMVVDMLCSNGENQTPVWQRLFWAIAVGVVAAVLSLAGGLSALQTLTIASALPFTIVLVIAMAGLLKALRIEVTKKESLAMNAVPMQPNEVAGDWQAKLKTIIDFPNKQNVERFLTNTVSAGMAQVAEYLVENDIHADIRKVSNGLELSVQHGDEQDFIYAVKLTKHLQPEFSLSAEDDPENATYYRAEVHLLEGGQDYDIMGWTQTAVSNDIVDQYQKHQHFLHMLR